MNRTTDTNRNKDNQPFGKRRRNRRKYNNKNNRNSKNRFNKNSDDVRKSHNHFKSNSRSKQRNNAHAPRWEQPVQTRVTTTTTSTWASGGGSLTFSSTTQTVWPKRQQPQSPLIQQLNNTEVSISSNNLSEKSVYDFLVNCDKRWSDIA